MFHKAIALSQQAVPTWTICDRTVDITDVWLEETDPENERNETAIAYLRADKYSDQLEVAGIAIIEPEGDRTYFDRTWFVDRYGISPIYRIEQYEMQATDYGCDDRYDEMKEASV